MRRLVAVQVAAIVVLGLVTVIRFHVWAGVDERAHFANVEQLAEHGRYPRQEELVSRDVQRVTLPDPPDPRSEGLYGRAYEGVQAPLYYALAVPAYLIPLDGRGKVTVLRLFDLALLLVALVLAAVLARELLGDRWRFGFAAVAVVVLWPGVLVRMITVSNDVLAVPAALLFALLAVRAYKQRTPRRLLLAGLVLGLAILTKATLVYLVPVLVLLAADVLRRPGPSRGARAAAVLALALPALLVLPWVLVNHARYGTYALVGGTAEIAALFPVDPRLDVDGVLPRLGRLTEAALPQEFDPTHQTPLGGIVTRGLVVALLAFAIAGAAAGRKRLGAAAAAALGLPLLAGVAGLVVEFARDGTDVFFGRYLYGAALLFALLGAAGWLAAGRERVVAGWVAATSAVAAGFWVYLAAAYYFQDVGRKLGFV
ncbi:MAG TPA: glycosyltransferase family 39 protein [Solirubrobacteraceae bacterium]|jgi:4-amino-4-deoxy-L-arabinose transferase-like glycosyltransferase